MEGKKPTDDDNVGYPEFGPEMRIKQEKHLLQPAGGLAQCNGIFSGIVAYLNGQTDPPQHELEDMVMQHGGLVEQNGTFHVTHIVSDALSNIKTRQFRPDESVVRPQWITDSIRDKRLLPIDEYQLCVHAPHEENQTNLSAAVAENETCPFSLENGLHSNIDGITDTEIGDENLTHPSLIDATDPNFLEHYFATSRLHHLSIWRQDLKLFAQSLMHKKKKRLQSGPPVIFHVDMDCFFASASLRDRQDLATKPVAITHAANRQDGAAKPKDSSSDLASCNYVAREFGIRNGMYIKTALQLCPDLILLPYEYGKYQQVSYELYRILADYADELQAVSCDEAFINVSSAFTDILSAAVDPSNLAEEIRKIIYQKLGCNASIGIGSNLLIARLATKKAKPNGQFYLKENMIPEHFKNLPLSDIPGVGWSIERQLGENGWKTCGDILAVPLSKLQELFGPKQGSTLYERVRGIDNRLISESKPRQSVGADVTWGVRFETQDQVYDFVNRLSLHVFSKLEAARLVAYRLQFRILRRTPGAGEPSKRLGHGECDAFSKSKSLRAGITFAMALQEACRMLCKSLNIPPREIRGVGIFLSNLAEKESGPKQTSVFSLMKHSQIDPTEKILKRLGYSREVFDELSEELRQEVIAEATRKKHAEILPTKQREPPTRKRESPIKSFSVKTGTKKAKTSIIEMLTSRPFAFAGLPQEIDQTVLDALPEEIRNELLEEYGLSSSTKS